MTTQNSVDVLKAYRDRLVSIRKREQEHLSTADFALFKRRFDSLIDDANTKLRSAEKFSTIPLDSQKLWSSFSTAVVCPFEARVHVNFDGLALRSSIWHFALSDMMYKAPETQSDYLICGGVYTGNATHRIPVTRRTIRSTNRGFTEGDLNRIPMLQTA